MYKPFFYNNIFSYIEFIGLLVLFMFLIYRNINNIYLVRFNKKTRKTKVLLLIIVFILNPLIYIFLDIFNIIWIISIAINAIMITLIIYLTISIIYEKNK